jgi:hypothetical protein
MAKDPDVDELMATRRWCYTIPREGFVKNRGWRVSIAIEGIQGHYPTGDLDFGKTTHVEPWFWGKGSYEDAEQFCAEQNQKLGYDVDDVWKIIASTLRGERPKRGRQRGKDGLL